MAYVVNVIPVETQNFSFVIVRMLACRNWHLVQKPKLQLHRGWLA